MMGIICMVLSLPVSIILARWLSKKKTGKLFEKGDVRKLIIAGMISMVVAAVVTLIYYGIRASLMVGFDTLWAGITNGDTNAILNVIEMIETITSVNTAEDSYIHVFLITFVTVGLVEELSRYLFLQLSTKNKEFAQTELDLVICGGIVGIGFQLLEDILFASGNIVTVIFRALTPFHFTFGAIMGYYIGKARLTGKKWYYALAILIPSVLHTLFDSSIQAISLNDGFLLLVLFSAALLIALTIITIVKIKKASEAEKKQAETAAM